MTSEEREAIRARLKEIKKKLEIFEPDTATPFKNLSDCDKLLFHARLIATDATDICDALDAELTRLKAERDEFERALIAHGISQTFTK